MSQTLVGVLLMVPAVVLLTVLAWDLEQLRHDLGELAANLREQFARWKEKRRRG